MNTETRPYRHCGGGACFASLRRLSLPFAVLALFAACLHPLAADDETAPVGDGLAIVAIQHPKGAPPTVEPIAGGVGRASKFDVIAWLRAPGGAPPPPGRFTITRGLRHASLGEGPPAELAAEMVDELYLMRVDARAGEHRGTGGEMWFVGKADDRNALQNEIEGARDAAKVRQAKTVADRCTALLDAARATKRPSMVLALEGNELFASNLPDPQRMDVMRGLVELMLSNESTDALRGEARRSLHFTFRDPAEAATARRFVLSRCAAKLRELSHEPGKRPTFEFLVLTEIEVLLRHRELRSTAEGQGAIAAAAEFGRALGEPGVHDTNRKYESRSIGVIERGADEKH